MACALYWVLLLPLVCAIQCPTLSSFRRDLQPRMSVGCSIVDGPAGPERWSDFAAPQSKFVVNVASENDVAKVVRFCNQNGLKFVTQNGGNGWANTFDLGDCGVIINIAGLNHINFNEEKTQAQIGGGVRVQAMVDAAYANGTRFANPSCPCLGFLGATLGGGLTRMAGLYGWSVDQLESVTVVLANGDIVHASDSTNADLFWALGGAGANFGIVTSAVVKAYPISMENNVAWQSFMTYSDDKLEVLITAIDELKMTPHMQLYLLMVTSGPPLFTPLVTAVPFYLGNDASEAEQAFAPLFAVGPSTVQASIIPYSHWSAIAEPFCVKGGRKVVYSTAGTKLDPIIFQNIYNEFKTFIAVHGPAVGNTSIVVEHFNIQTGLDIGDSRSSYSHRSSSYHTVAIPWYQDATFDPTADAWGRKMRDLFREMDVQSDNSTYINFAHGDEDLQDIYGSSLPRLQALKAQYDPYNRFNQWYPLMK